MTIAPTRRLSVSVANATRGSGIDGSLSLCGLPGPGQQRAQLVGFGPGRNDTLEDIAQIGEGLDAIELGRLDQRGDDGPAFGALIGAGEEVVLGAELDWSDGALDGVGVDFDPAVLEEEAEPLPVAQCIADRVGEGGFGRDARELLLQPCLHGLDQRPALGWAGPGALMGRAAVDARLDLVEFGDPPQRLGGDRGAGGVVEI